VVVGFPISHAALRERVVQEALEIYLQDNVEAWELQPDGSYLRVNPGDGAPVCAQGVLLKQYADIA
jgi:polyphosphate kinase